VSSRNSGGEDRMRQSSVNKVLCGVVGCGGGDHTKHAHN
jgi:hypothetical protein